MSTRLRDQSPGYHHVVARGNNKRTIFTTDRERQFFCMTLDRVAKKYEWTVLAYCLMDNHYHLLLSIGDKGLGDGMCELNTAYAVWFNAEHDRINHLFGRRYWNRRIRTDASMMNVLRYIVQNPRRAGGTRPLEAYAWTSYAATIGIAFAQVRLDRDAVLSFFGSKPDRAIEAYKVFCSATGLPRPVPRQPP